MHFFRCPALSSSMSFPPFRHLLLHLVVLLHCVFRFLKDSLACSTMALLARRSTAALRRSPLTLHRSLSSSPLRLQEDFRPASAQQFTNSEVADGIAALSAAGYDASTVWEQKVCWGDHDQFQHVNNVHFVRWFESARMFFATTLTKDLAPERQEEIAKGTGKSFILAGINVRYRRPVVYPDTVSMPSITEGRE